MAFYRKAGGIGAAAILTPDDQNNPDKSHIDRHAPNCSRSLLHSMTQRCLPACLPATQDLVNYRLTHTPIHFSSLYISFRSFNQ